MNRYVNFKRTGLANETIDNDGSTCPGGRCDQCGVPICMQEDDPDCTQVIAIAIEIRKFDQSSINIIHF